MFATDEQRLVYQKRGRYSVRVSESAFVVWVSDLGRSQGTSMDNHQFGGTWFPYILTNSTWTNNLLVSKTGMLLV